MKGLVTGLELPPIVGRGRPQIYINAKARRLHARLRELQRLIYEVATETGFTPEAEKAMRGEMYRLANLLNVNKLKKRKRNPAPRVHAQLAHGMAVAVCGHRVTSERSEPIAAVAAVVTCPTCRAANISDEDAPATYGPA